MPRRWALLLAAGFDLRQDHGLGVRVGLEGLGAAGPVGWEHDDQLDLFALGEAASTGAPGDDPQGHGAPDDADASPVPAAGLAQGPSPSPAAARVLEALGAIDPDALNPRQALEALYRLRGLLDHDGTQ